MIEEREDANLDLVAANHFSTSGSSGFGDRLGPRLLGGSGLSMRFAFLDETRLPGFFIASLLGPSSSNGKSAVLVMDGFAARFQRQSFDCALSDGRSAPVKAPKD
jgi:hypothetical protein